MSTIKDSPSNDKTQDPKCLPSQQPVLLPRNLVQIKNIQANQRQSARLSRDALVNLHELAYNLGDFVYKITTYPDLVVVCDSKPILSELDRIIKVNSDHPVLLF